MVDESRLQSLLPVWSWLPAFRAIAETEHLPTAARLCGVGPSSLSRSLTLLERSLARQLFERTGRSLTLNPDGEILLVAVRDAMRRIDDALQELAGSEFRGTVRIGSASAGITALIARALEQLRQEHPKLVPLLLSHPAERSGSELLRGRLDVAFQESAYAQDGLLAQQVGSISRSVYCGRQHALFASPGAAASAIEGGEFVAPPPAADGLAPDGWPAARPRHIALVTDQLRVGLELCIEQPLLAVLPDVLASQRPKELRPLTAIPIAASPIFAVRRKALGPQPSAAARVIELVERINGSSARATDRSSPP